MQRPDLFTLSGLFYIILALILFSCTGEKQQGTNYYFDPLDGNDLNPGTSPDRPLKSLGLVAGLSLQPGDSVLLKSGAMFTDPLYVSCKGAQGRPVVLGKYGGKERPHIMGDASLMQAVHIFNSEYTVIRDLEISNRRADPVAGLHGLLVELSGFGTARMITIDNLYVHDVYGSLVREEKDGGHAILIRNYNEEVKDSVLSRFDGLLVQNCLIRDCQRSGIVMWGNWERKKWFPNLNVVIRHNVLEGVPGDGIVPVGCESPLVEYNVMRSCPPTLPPTEACDGIWPWSCDHAVVQYNIVSGHRSRVDGYGFDSDWNSTHSLFQYNLSFNNDGGFLLVCNSGGWPPDWCIGNRNSLVRYNISINDGLRDYPVRENYFFSPVIHVTGPTSNTVIEKNLFIVLGKPKPEIDRTLIHMTDWRGYPDSTCFRDNFIFLQEPNLAVDPGNSTNNVFENNIYVGELAAPEQGFEPREGNFDRGLWFDENDVNWVRLLNFIKDKSVNLNGEEVSILEIIGFHE